MFRFTLVTTLATLAGAFSHVSSKLPPSGGRIVGGVYTTIEEHPYQLALEYYGNRHCGASLIQPNIALTAAHCTSWKQASSLKIRAGSTFYGKGGELADVVKICSHPKYIPYDYDVSVILLNRTLPLSASIKTISLQPVGVEVQDGTFATITGWGRLASGGAPPSILQKVEVPKVNVDSCKKAYRMKMKNITDRMDCYGYTEGGKDSCQGDSGGPLVVDGKQTGIVSWGTGCAEPRLPGANTKVSNKEITDHINSCVAKFLKQ